MSFLKRIIDVFTGHRAQATKEIEKAPPKGVGIGDVSGSLFDFYGLAPLGDNLRLENTLLARFADAEAMDEYPELHCIHGDTRISTPDGEVTIRELAEREQAGVPQLVASVIKKKWSSKPTVAKGYHASLTKKNAECVKVTTVDGHEIICTSNHPFLTAQGEYLKAEDLGLGQKIVAVETKFGEDHKRYWAEEAAWALAGVRRSKTDSESLEIAAAQSKASAALLEKRVVKCGAQVQVTEIESIEPAGHHDVYDIAVPGLRCYVANGLVIHNSALDIYADDSTVPDTLSGRTVWVESDDEAIKEKLETLFWKVLDIDEVIWAIARTLCKYGNDYEELFITDNGVVGMQGLPPATIRRLEDAKGGLLGYVQDMTGEIFNGRRSMPHPQLREVLQGKTPAPDGITVFKDFEIAHFKLRGSDRFNSYGVGVLEAGRWVWRRLVMLEDALMIYKLTRSPARYVYNIDVGQLPPKQALSYIQRVKASHRKRKLVNPRTNQLDMRINPLTFDEDIWVPVRDGRPSTTVDLLEGSPYQGIEDVEYFLRKLYAAIKIPKSYLNFEEAAPSRTILSNEDIRFSRTVLRIQREIRNGLRRIAKIHLIALNINPADSNFEVFMTVPSAIYELAQLEIRGARADLASRMGEFVSRQWLMVNLLGFTEAEAAKIEKQKQKEEGGGGAGFGASKETPGEPLRPKPEKMTDKDRRMLAKLDKILSEDAETKSRIDNLRKLCMDLRGAVFSKNGRGKLWSALRATS